MNNNVFCEGLGEVCIKYVVSVEGCELFGTALIASLPLLALIDCTREVENMELWNDFIAISAIEQFGILRLFKESRNGVEIHDHYHSYCVQSTVLASKRAWWVGAAYSLECIAISHVQQFYH